MRVSIFILLLLFVSCTGTVTPAIPKPGPNTQTYVPIYMSPEAVYNVQIEAPRPIINSGKIYVIGNYLLQVETDSGIHVINYSNPASPQKVVFIKSMFCSEMNIKGQFLYINNLNDLVVLNIADITKPVVVNRVSNAFPLNKSEFPNDKRGFFECPDPDKGIVMGWKIETRDYPKCYR